MNTLPEDIHPRIARRVVEQYNKGFYEESISNAYKVIEDRLREILRREDTANKLIDYAFNTTNGLLTNPNLWPSEREGIFLFLKGLFSGFRDRSAHSFRDPDQRHAYDFIIILNRVMYIIEEAYLQSQSRSIKPKVLFSVNEVSDESSLLDIDNDGEPEFVSVQNNTVVVQKIKKDKVSFVTVEPLDFPFMALGKEVRMVDVDNDGYNEAACILHWDTASAVVFYKYENNQLSIMAREDITNQSQNSEFPYFVEGLVQDIDGDGRVEVISYSRNEFLDNKKLPLEYQSLAEEYGYKGYVQRVWRWNQNSKRFECIDEIISDIQKY